MSTFVPRLTCFVCPTVRLSNTYDLNYGKLEVYRNGTWTAVCDQRFSIATARVACRELGYTDGRYQLGSVLGMTDSANITVVGLQCNGNEARLEQCKYSYGTCPTNHYVTVYCNETTIKEKSKLELRIKENRYYGSLEANKYGFWGPICPDGWSDDTASAACRQLGYIGGMAFNGTSRLNKPMALGSFQCNGRTNLSECSFKGFNEDIGCRYPIKGHFLRPTAGVLCYKHPEGVQFRLSESRRRGKVEIMFNGEWGRVCNSSWGDSEAGVFCRSQGFIDGKAETFEGRSQGHVWMNYIECEGHEKSILECSNNWTPGSANCDDAGVVCYDSVRLAKGDYLSHGAVEVSYNNKWGVVCNHNWDQREVDITCNQMGYESGLPLCCAPFGYIKSHGNMENLQCTGHEKRLTDCPHDLPYGAVCSMDYAAVSCYNGSLPTSIELSISGRDNATGAVIVTYNNISGRICSDGWDDNDAAVVCRQLGYAYGQSYSHYKWSIGRGDHGPFWTSQVNCTGSEERLQDCPKVPFGQVQECINRHYAGALCYQKYGVAHRIVGGEWNYGRVEVSVDGVWGTLCNKYWDVNDAKVLCRSMNFVTGFPLYTGSFGEYPDKIYQSNLHCNGTESNLRECPHEGWEEAKDGLTSCADHTKDAAVHCYNSVKLGSGVGRHITHGPVLYYNQDNNNWEAVCDRGFNDDSATLVCKELGFDVGKAILGSAYGKIYEDILENKTMSCTEDDVSVAECVREGVCNQSDFYASVACFSRDSKDLEDEDYRFQIQQGDAGDNTGIVQVTHYGLQGRICSNGWDNVDAMVLCRSLSFQHGIAIHLTDNEFSPLLSRGPYWMADVRCEGNEHQPYLQKCSFSARLDFRNCSEGTNAAVLCYHENGVEYRIANDNNTGENFGRVEISLNRKWGTICDASWDDTEARVLCRQKGYHDGYALKGAYYGQRKSGPIWLSHLKCTGNEDFLHKCPHRGFNSAIVEGDSSWWKCRSHKDDASVYCINDLKLSQGFNASIGAVLVHKKGSWHTVCDAGFDSRDARVVCRTLGYSDGKVIHGSAFGNISYHIGFVGVGCDGSETEFKNCKMSFDDRCTSGTYASVTCSHENIIDTGFHVRIRPDYGKKTASFHGYLEVHVDGVWGSVCENEWDNNDANVVCRQLGYHGGAAYRPPKNFTSPVFIDNVRCQGSERSLLDCVQQKWTAADGCDFYSRRAGVFCFDEKGINFRLGGGEADRGRVEMQYNGIWGGICEWLWDSRDASVFCRHLGYSDGLEVVGARYGHVDGPLWFTRVSCKGDEDSILQCRHTGFNSSDELEGVYAGLCRTRSHDAAARCFHRKLEITDIRLVNKYNDPSYGRVEVYLAGANQWGTVCDDYWGDNDASVVCRQLGFAKGTGVKGAHFGRGKGPVWLDNLRCYGNETKLGDCKHNSFAVQNCNHGEDAGVYCSGTYTPPGGKPSVSEASEGPQTLETSYTIVIVVTVTVIVFLVLIILIGGYILYRRARPRSEIKKVLVQNDMNDPNPTASQPATDGRVTLSKLKAHFTKPKSGEEATRPASEGVSNPVYQSEGGSGIIMGDTSIEQPVKQGFEV